jgi:hypothetical protein
MGQTKPTSDQDALTQFENKKKVALSILTLRVTESMIKHFRNVKNAKLALKS